LIHSRNLIHVAQPVNINTKFQIFFTVILLNRRNSFRGYHTENYEL